MPADPRLVRDAPLPYLLSVPPAATDGPSPLLCFLHGYDEGAPAEIRGALARHGPLAPHAWSGARDRFVIVAPQLPVAGDRWRRHADDVGRIVDAVRGAHGADPARTYLTGFSFGGNGALDLALHAPGRWAAVWAVDPTRPPARGAAPPVWISAGAIARRARDAFVSVLSLTVDATPTARDVPAADRVWVDAGDDHVGAATRAYADPRPYAWLLARSRPTSDTREPRV